MMARALRALKWNYVGTVGRIVATFLSQVFLARLLGPEQFGMFGYAFLTITLVALVAEMGIGQALIQVSTLSAEVLAIACGRLLFLGLTASCAVYGLAEPIAAHAFTRPEAAPVIRAMAPTLVLGAAIAAATAVRSRDLEFKTIQLAQLGAYVGGYLIIGVTAAWVGLGVWSLVLAWYCFSLGSLLLMWMRAPRSLLPGNPFRKLPIADFGRVIMLTNIVNWVIDSAAQVFIGRSFGAVPLGQFTIANNLVKVPADHLVRNLQSVLMPLAARANDDDAGLRHTYLTALSAVGVIVFPLFAFVATMAHPIVMVLLGAKWEGAAAILVPLSLATGAHAVEALCGPLLSGLGQPRVELRVKGFTLALMLVVLAVASQWSIIAVAWALLAVFLLRWSWMNAALMRRLQLSWREYGRALTGPTLLAATAAGVGVTVHTLFAWQLRGAPEAIQLMSAILAAMVAIGLLVMLAPVTVFGIHVLLLLDRMFVVYPSVARLAWLRPLAASARRATGLAPEI